ncbi:D-glucarate permease [Klebsiella pneumoniae subsp. pneumoniae]|uniref:D-glucarate permease n=1 Tax=Klebsiella pneumoniae subsp. pneumoniae TaxID=72407 RepID=A0A377Z781_KLEPN|nr:D-glucarate permease [Klebsiella pneumoniae subsp. pneumoniae]
MSSLSQAATAAEKRTNARYWIVVMLFIVTSFNYGDRATLSIAGSEMARDIGLDPVGMGYVFSAFSWAYVIGQIPGGWLLDRFGSKRVYFWSIFIWSMFTLLQGFVDIFSGFGIIVALFTLRFLVGLAESPSFPATAGSSPPGSRRRRGGQRYRFLTPPSTLPPLFSRRSWAG